MILNRSVCGLVRKVACLCVRVMAIATPGIMSAHGQAAEPRVNQVTFQSATYADFGQLQRQTPAATVTVAATLSFPDEARDRYPAVVVVHTIAGYLEGNEGQYAAALRNAGFATLTYDSFAARGSTGVALARSYAAKWLTSQPLRAFVPRSIRARPGLPRTLRIIRPVSSA